MSPVRRYRSPFRPSWSWRGGGPTSSNGPAPEVLGLAAVVGLGSVWLLTRRRRRRTTSPAPVAASVAAAPPDAGWTNVRLDDNDALPAWLRTIPQTEQASPASSEPLFAMEQPRSSEPEVELAPPGRLAQTFLEPLPPGAMRLAVTTYETSSSTSRATSA